MRIFGPAFAMFVSLASAPALADDYNDWAGGYIGGHADIVWSETDATTDLDGSWLNGGLDSTDRAALLPLLNGGISDTLVSGGVTLGYNWQFGALVTGLEIDISALGDTDQHSVLLPSGANQPYRVETHSDVPWLSTLLGRVGAGYDKTLFYATGGLAVGRHDYSQSIIQLESPVYSFTETGSFSEIATGWALGAGVEQQVSEHWNLRLDYLHVELGSNEASSAGVCINGEPGCLPYTGSHEASVTMNMLKFGASYQF